MTPIELAKKGWHLIPWSKRASSSRQPMVKGYLGTLPTPEEVAEWHRKWPSCDWAIKPTFHVVLDIEMKNGMDGEAELIEKFHPLEGFPSTKTFNGGRHVWMRVPHDCTLKGGVRIAKPLEVKFKASVHIPPSEGYEWITPLGALTDVPMAPDWFMEAWAKAAPVSIKATETASFPEGQRHALLCSAAGALRNLGLGEEGIFLGLQGVRADRCENPETVPDDELRGIAKSYAKKEASESFDMRLARGEERAVQVANFISRNTGPVPVAKEINPLAVPKLSAEHLRPTPLIAAWVDWCLSCAPRPQPELSLLAACVGMGALIGRDLTWRRSHANIYGLGLASSGSGKDVPLHSIRKVFAAVGCVDLLGSMHFDSDAGMFDEINQSPSITWAVDEIGLFLQQIKLPTCPGYMKKVCTNLTEWYSCQPIKGKALKGQTATEIHSPFPSVLTFCQPKIFSRVYDDALSEQGMINRFVPFMGEHLPEMRFDFEDTPPPEDMVAALTKMNTEIKRSPVENAGATRKTQEIACDPDVLAHYYTKAREVEATVQSTKLTDEKRSTLMSRCVETSKRFSLIHAYTMNVDQPHMTKESIDWGFAIAAYTTDVLLHITNNAATTPHALNIDRIYAAVRTSGEKGMSPSVLIQRTMRDVEAQKREAVLSDLVKADRIRIYEIKAKTGQKTKRYFADHFFAACERNINEH